MTDSEQVALAKKLANLNPYNRAGRLAMSTHAIHELLDDLWLGGAFPTEREARKAGFRGDSTRFCEVRYMWAKGKNKKLMRAYAVTAKSLRRAT